MARPRRAVRNQRRAEEVCSPKQQKPATSDSPPMSGQDSPHKACIQCHDYKSLNDFPRNRNRQDGRDNRCKRCTARVVAARVARRAPVLTAQVSHKVCVRCGKEKPAAAFNRNKVRPDGLCSYCKVCNAAAAAERRKTRQPVLEPTVSHKMCSECNEDQPAAAFHRSKSYNDGLYGKCKRCCAMALQRRRAAAEGGSLPPTPHSGSRRGGRHQHYEPHFGSGLGSADISSMLSDATRYGDPITKAMAELVAENARSGNPARTPQELAIALLQGGTPRKAVETRLPGLVSTMFGRSGGSGAATETAGLSSDEEGDEGGDSDDSAHTASRDGRSEPRSGRSGNSSLPPRHARFADGLGARPALGLTAADLGGGAFGSPQSTLAGDPSGTASAATRTSLRNSSSLNTGGAGGGRPGSGPPAAAAGRIAGEEGADPSPKRRTRQSIRTTSRLNAAYAIEMMRAEGAKDMRHIMDALVEPADTQDPEQPSSPGRGRRSQRPRRAPAHYRDDSPGSPPEDSQGTDRSGQHRPTHGGPHGEQHASHIAAGDWGLPGPGSTTSGSPASAQTPLYANAPSAGLLAKLQAARAMSRQRMLENLAAQGLPPPPEPMRNELQQLAAGFSKGPAGSSTPYQTALELMGLAPNLQQQQAMLQQPGTAGSQMSGGSFGGNNAAFFGAALASSPSAAAVSGLSGMGLSSAGGFGSQVSGGSSLGSQGKRPRDIDPSALAAMDVGLPSPKRHAHLRQILDASGGSPWAAAAAAHPSAPSAANSAAVRRAATSSGMLMPPPELPGGFRGSNGGGGAGHLPPAAQAPLQNFGLSGAMADPAGAAAAAAAAWGTSGAPGGGAANPAGRSLIDNYLPPASGAAISAYAAQMRGGGGGGGGAPGGPFSPSRSAGSSQPALPFGVPQAGSPAGGYNAAAFTAELASLAATNPAAIAAATSKLLDPNHAAFAESLRRSSGLSTPRGARLAAPSPALSPSEAAAARWADFILGSSTAARQAQSRSQSPPSPGQQAAAAQVAAQAAQAAALISPLRPTATRAANGGATPPLPASLPGTPGGGRGARVPAPGAAPSHADFGSAAQQHAAAAAAQLQAAHQAAQLQALLGNPPAAEHAAPQQPPQHPPVQQQAQAPTLQQHLHQQLEQELAAAVQQAAAAQQAQPQPQPALPAAAAQQQPAAGVEPGPQQQQQQQQPPEAQPIPEQAAEAKQPQQSADQPTAPQQSLSAEAQKAPVADEPVTEGAALQEAAAEQVPAQNANVPPPPQEQPVAPSPAQA